MRHAHWIRYQLQYLEEVGDTKRGKQNRWIEGQTTQMSREKGQRTNKDLQNTTQKTNDRATRTPLKNGGELRCPGRIISSWSTSVILVTSFFIFSLYWCRFGINVMTCGVSFSYHWYNCSNTAMIGTTLFILWIKGSKGVKKPNIQN
jgi:hypothetical protein